MAVSSSPAASRSLARWLLLPAVLACLVAVLFATQGRAAPPPSGNVQGTAHYVSERRPAQGPGRDLGADRPLVPSGAQSLAAAAPYTNPWQLQATLPGAVAKDISFPTAQVGYIAAELGQVWKSTNGGANWSPVLNLGFPYYWYGVQALDASNVIISGFINTPQAGVARWSSDGGVTWSPNITLTNNGWSFRVRFADPLHALVMDGLNMSGPNAAHYTSNGGHTAADWTPVVPDPSGGWFGNQFSLLSNLRARASGITYCDSPNGGATWSCRPSVDSVFDGPTFFATDQAGWVGGGSISPTVEGWAHRTTDGGATWSPRTLSSPWPVREIRFVDDQRGWAAGGNLYSGVGGMYYSSDGGQTWALDINTGAEMDACDSLGSGSTEQAWCAGYSSNAGSFSSVVYTLGQGGGTPTPTSTLTPTSTVTPVPTFTLPPASTLTSTPSATATASVTPCAFDFSDVRSSDYFYTAVGYLYCRGAISGYSDGTFRPYNDTTRGQLTKIVVLAESWSIDTTGGPHFTDVPANNPFYAFVETAYNRGIISGYSDGTFRWGANVTRGQLAKIIVLAQQWPIDTRGGPHFADVLTSNPYYAFVETAYNHGIISGYSDGTFRPGNNATRGQISKIVYSAVDGS